jgi:prepilin-type N-terminal cleavage/methylation domain-containing protein
MTQRKTMRRGFTLIELLISMAIVLLAIGLAGAGFIAQNQALQSTDLQRVANSNNRDAMVVIEHTLRAVGWGVDPRYAIDLTSGVNIASVDRAAGAGTAGTDILTVLARNPMYQWRDTADPGCGIVGGCFVGAGWRVEAASTNLGAGLVGVTLTAGQVFELGRLIQLQCIGGTDPVILRVTGRRATAGLQVLPFSVTNAFPYNDTASLKPCHGQAGATVFQIDRTRFYVADHTVAGVTTPWLMMDPTVDVDNDTNIGCASGVCDADDVLPIAKNIEDFQVAYVLPNNPAPPDAVLLDNVIGNAPATVELPAAPANTTSLPQYTTPASNASRRSTASANVRGIRVSLITRSIRTDPNRPTYLGDAVPYGENRGGACPAGCTPTGGANRFLRFPMATEITLRNMMAERPFTF